MSLRHGCGWSFRLSHHLHQLGGPGGGGGEGEPHISQMSPMGELTAFVDASTITVVKDDGFFGHPPA